MLQEQARVAIVQRDDALRRLSAAEEEVRHHSAGLRNLQTVLEQFQQGVYLCVLCHLQGQKTEL